jgi:translocation and assembly module TamA
LARPGSTFAAIAAMSFAAAAATAAPRGGTQLRARVEGAPDNALRAEIERAIGEEHGDPANRVDARRRARLAAENAVALLRSEGYYDETVEPDIGEGEHPQALVRINLGPRTTIADAQVQWKGGEPDVAAKTAAVSDMKLKTGSPARAADVLAALGRVIATLQLHGYANAKSQPLPPVVDHASHTMHPVFAIAAGALVRLDGLKIEAKSRTKAAFIKKLAPWKSGEIYKPYDVAELERRLLDTGVYDSITVALAPAPNPDGLTPVVVGVADRTKHSFSFGAGYSTTDGPVLDTTWSTFNMLDSADTLSVFAKDQKIDSRVGVTLSLPDFWNSSQTLKFGPDVFNDVTNAYTTTGAEFVVDLTQRYGKTSFFTRGISFVASRIDDHELGSLDIFSIRPLAEYALDHTDNPLNPTKGWKWDTRVEPIGILGQEQLVYLKVQSQISSYWALDADGTTVLAGRVQAGSIIGGKIPQVPASDRFFAGGGGTVRGYTYQNVGPHYPDNTPQGGLSLLDGSLELRRKLMGPFGGVLFMDSGSVGTLATPSVSHVASSIGVGFRYDLGFAPLRADFAFPLNHVTGASQAPFQVYLSIGQSF